MRGPADGRQVLLHQVVEGGDGWVLLARADAGGDAVDHGVGVDVVEEGDALATGGPGRWWVGVRVDHTVERRDPPVLRHDTLQHVQVSQAWFSPALGLHTPWRSVAVVEEEGGGFPRVFLRMHANIQ